MMPFGNSWEWWLLSLLILRGLCSLGIFIAKRRSMSIDRDSILQAREETLNRLTKVAILGICCFLSGRWERDLEQFNNSHILHNVRIVKVEDAQHWIMTSFDRPSDDFRVIWCTPEASFGERMMFKDMTFEDRGDCWTMKWTDNTKLGYRLYETKYQGENKHGAP